jgi:hypothetical protein
MGILRRGIIGVLAAAAVTTGAITAFAVGGNEPAPRPSSTLDVKGPCDEAEHANDARCDGAQVPEDRAGVHDRNDDNGGVTEGNDDGPNHDANDDNGGLAEGNDDRPNHDANDDNGGERNDSGSSDNSGPGSSNSGSGSSRGDD